MGLYLVYLVTFVISLVAATAVFLYWVANRKRIAAETVGRAQEQALRIQKDAGRAMELYKKYCDRGNAMACRMMGTLFYSGTGVARSRT